MARKPAVLFVCLGNICRSPLAEAAFRAEAGRRGLDVVVDSAGTGRWHLGKPPDRRAQAVARQHGLDISNLRARQVDVTDFALFSHIVAMDAANLAVLRDMAPRRSGAALSLLLDHVPGRSGEPVPDPYLGGAEGFRRVWEDVAEGARALAEELERLPARL